jgi:hypothetical protein
MRRFVLRLAGVLLLAGAAVVWAPQATANEDPIIDPGPIIKAWEPKNGALKLDKVQHHRPHSIEVPPGPIVIEPPRAQSVSPTLGSGPVGIPGQALTGRGGSVSADPALEADRKIRQTIKRLG